MKLTGKTLIDERKIREYLLVWKPKDDKSKFLNLLGYTYNNWTDLQADIESIVKNNEVESSKESPFGGSLCRVIGILKETKVVTVWLNFENEIKFITLFPV